MGDPKILDQQGQEQSWDWLVANFGAINLERPAVTTGKVFRVVKLQDAEGAAVQIVQVFGLDGIPMSGVGVVRWWPDAPKLPGWGDEVSQWRKRGVYGLTNLAGDIGFGMGHGDYYFPPDGGASGVWVADIKGQSDFVSGLGMLGGTNHRHIDVFYQLVDLDLPPVEPPDEPPDQPPDKPPDEPPDKPPDQPPADPWPVLFEKLDRIIALLEVHSG
jgi:hypothetical protein